MKLSFKSILPIILISALLILLAGCFGVPGDESPGTTTTGTGIITGIIAAPCCDTSGEPVSENSGSPEYWCYWCEKNWFIQGDVEVILTSGQEEIATTTTNKNGEYTFTGVPPGENYVITAYCPDKEIPLVMDVVPKLAEGKSFDAGTTDLVSTSLGLVVDYVIYFEAWDPEDISLDKVMAAKPNFDGFPKFKKLIREVRRVLENCEDVDEDDKLLDALCKAAEEVGKSDFGCAPGLTLEPEPEPEPTGGAPTPTPPPAVITYTLTMAVNPAEGGTTSPAVGSHTYNSGTVVPITATPADEGWYFDEWTGDASGTNSTTSVTMNTNKAVTANFYNEEVQPETYTVTFDSQSATVEADPTSKTVTAPATTVDTLPLPPTKICYDFGGWYTETNGSGTEFTDSTIVTASITVYAKWTANPTAKVTLTAIYDLLCEPGNDTELWWHASWSSHTCGRDYMEVNVKVEDATSLIGSVTIEIHYDNTKLDECTYPSPLDSNDDGTIILTSSNDTSIKFKKWGPDTGDCYCNHPTVPGSDWTDDCVKVEVLEVGTEIKDSDGHVYCLTYDSLCIDGDNNPY